MRRRLSPARLAVALVTVALVTGCAAGPGGEPRPTVLPQPSAAAPTTTSAEPAGESRALELIGLWRVSGAAGESDETWLRLAGGEFQLLRECGMIGGSWNAGGRAFLTSVYMASGECVDQTTHQMPAVPWLASATAYEPTEAGWRLTDDSGATMASLAIDGAPEPIDTAAESYVEPPVIDDATRAALGKVAALPESLEPATAAELHGRWSPVAAAVASKAHVEFHDSGAWTGSDGCNGNGGRWTTERDGELVTTAGGSTNIGCDNIPVDGWVGGARLAGFDGDELVLLDVSGVELGRLQQAD